mgnify:CR=1 FL=1
MKELMVLVPFYQREQGVLNRTLQSIEQQTCLACIKQVVIVDDGSPIPADDELDGLSSLLSEKILIIKQQNQGVSVARNVALQYALDHTSYVAFLDSDDTWLPTHVASMIEAFELGAQFYFSNFYQPEQNVGAFERGGRLSLASHRKLQDQLYAFDSDMVEQILVGNLIGTSTVGFKISDFKALRFRENLQFAGEDYLFWLDIAKAKPIIIFNNQITVEYGKGVNIFASATWGTMHLQHRLTDELSFLRTVVNDYTINERTLHEVKCKMWYIRKQLLLNTLSLMRQREGQVLKHFSKLIFNDPKVLLGLFVRRMANAD